MNAESAPSLISKFKRCLVSFLDELIDHFPTKKELIIFRIIIQDQLDPKVIVNHCIKNILPYAHLIEQRDESLFTEKDVLFSAFNATQTNHMKSIWTSTTLDANNRLVIWKWFDAFISLLNQINPETDVDLKKT